ncbi:hypothetical protein CPC08DRAFT_771860 [Agrocybe pediades]|nr:hypothetical protein CPC08DRAFT_771860 [Agrocybe pediades]
MRHKRPEVNEETKNHFVGGVVSELSICEAARRFGLKRSTAHNIWKKYEETGSVENLPQNVGPRKEIANTCNPKISVDTVCNILKKHNYH